MQHCLLFTRILKISCNAAIKSYFKISVHKYYVVGIKTEVVAIQCIKSKVFFCDILPFTTVFYYLYENRKKVSDSNNDQLCTVA